ncbi:hypothetical protein PGJ44_000689 [Enterococcus faecalis]|nr:hypothetical protein [Enterococcus faecalis]EMD7411825.1 hypothetical protein [Enterococcus faecalis]
MSSELTDFMNTTDRKIETGNFLIKYNYLQFQNMTIQMSKISKLNVSIKNLILLNGQMIFSILLFFYLPIGLVGVVLCVAYWFLLYSDYKNGNNYLPISMNSGEIYILYIRDKEFLLTIRQVIESYFTNKINKILINIE